MSEPVLTALKTFAVVFVNGFGGVAFVMMVVKATQRGRRHAAWLARAVSTLSGEDVSLDDLNWYSYYCLGCGSLPMMITINGYRGKLKPTFDSHPQIRDMGKLLAAKVITTETPIPEALALVRQGHPSPGFSRHRWDS